MTFHLKYFLLFILIFIAELLIATVFREYTFLRSYVGDVLVVILIYTFILSFFKIKNKTKLIVGIFLFALFVEVLQYFKLADILQLPRGSWQYTVLGNTFSWADIICYAVGCAIVYFAERKITKKDEIRY